MPQDKILKVTIERLWAWFRDRNSYRRELRDWRSLFRELGKKVSKGAPLSKDEMEFVVTSCTALFDTPAGLIAATQEHVEVSSVVEKIQHRIRELVNEQCDRVIRAAEQHHEALVRLVEDASQSLSHGYRPNAKNWRDFNATIEVLKKAAKDLSLPPGHRERTDPEVERKIHAQRAAGKTYGEIALDLSRGGRKLTAKVVERLHKRYIERNRKAFAYFFSGFGPKDPDTMPR